MPASLKSSMHCATFSYSKLAGFFSPNFIACPPAVARDLMNNKWAALCVASVSFCVSCLFFRVLLRFPVLWIGAGGMSHQSVCPMRVIRFSNRLSSVWWVSLSGVWLFGFSRRLIAAILPRLKAGRSLSSFSWSLCSGWFSSIRAVSTQTEFRQSEDN